MSKIIEVTTYLVCISIKIISAGSGAQLLRFKSLLLTKC